MIFESRALRSVRAATCAAACGILTFAGCAPLPRTTPTQDELPDLRRRVERSRADTESVLRLAAGLWSEGDRAAAIRVLEDAWAAVPEATVYAAALGGAYEAMGAHETARDRYLAFVAAGRESTLRSRLVERVAAGRGETAGPLVRRLLAGDRPSSLGFDRPVAAVPRLEAPDGDQELSRLAAAVTELLVLDLRDFLPVIDWELAHAAREAVDEGGPPTAVARSVNDLLGTDRVVLGSLLRTRGDSVSLELVGVRSGGQGGEVVEADSISTALESFADVVDRLTKRAFEMLIGAEEGSLSELPFEQPVTLPLQALLAMGDGLLAADSGAFVLARAHFARAEALAPSFPPLLDRIDQMTTLEAFRASPTLPLADETLDLARRQRDMAFLIRASGTAAPTPMSPTRQGVGELLGLDRLGSQVFLDFIITVEGTEP